MGYTLALVVLVIFLNTTTAFEEYEEDYSKATPYEEYYEFTSPTVDIIDKEQVAYDEAIINGRTGISDEEISLPNDEILARYEVTENVIDVPNNESISGPLITDFTIKKPLNNGTANKTNQFFFPNVNVNSDSNKENADGEKENSDKNKQDTDNKNSINGRKNYLSILHVKSEYEDDKKDVNIVQNINVDKPPNFNVFPGIREYFHGIRRGIVKGLHSLVHKDADNVDSLVNKEQTDVHNDVDKEFDKLHSVLAAPVIFFSKIGGKGADVASKVHRAIFRHGDDFDD